MERNDHIEKIKTMKAARERGLAQMKEASMLPSVSCNNPSGIIVFDTETTGLSCKVDEIIQISIIDGYGNTLLNTYVKTYWMTQWPDAQAVNGITPEMVKDAPAPAELIPVVKGIFESAKTAVSYNGQFDMEFLEMWGVKTAAEMVDVMPMFARVYGMWEEHYEDWKWQKLTTAAAHYGYEYNAHDSLEDVKATYFVYQKILQEPEEIRNRMKKL